MVSRFLLLPWFGVIILVAEAFTEALDAPEIVRLPASLRVDSSGYAPTLRLLPGLQRSTLDFKIDFILGEVDVGPFY